MTFGFVANFVQIIQINIVLKNSCCSLRRLAAVQIIQINIVLKNGPTSYAIHNTVQIIQINIVLKNICKM